MEMSLGNSEYLKVFKWPDVLKRKYAELEATSNGTKKDTVVIMFGKNEVVPAGMESAWRKLCRDKKRVPHVMIKRHVLGVTAYLVVE